MYFFSLGSFLLNLAYMDEIDINLQGTDRNPHGTVRVQTGIQWKEIYMKVCRTLGGVSGVASYITIDEHLQKHRGC